MSAVHFGAGNIGRGFVGLLLDRAGHDLVFADVDGDLIAALGDADSYEVHEVGREPATHTVDGFRAVHSAEQADELVAEIAAADIVTTAVGAHVLVHLAPAIADGIAARSPEAPRLAVLACENAINATDILQGHVEEAWVTAGHDGDLHDRALFANTAVDRIVPDQDPGLDVAVEPYLEWVVDRTPFAGAVPDIPGVTWVDDLGPYIERKLFTVNTGHATTAWFGHAVGIERIADALADDDVASRVRAVLDETAALVVAKHGIDPEVQAAYVDRILDRFANPHLPDTTARVGRAPLRKLSRNERFVSPASQLAERGMDHDALVTAMGAGLDFDAPDDPEAAELAQVLDEHDADAVVDQVMGIPTDHPLHAELVDLVATHQAR
ncbi:mannitol-1-phosphate 5-dehydrogenase [Salsipaludibacter albus]|uniref:mannitol-1-phosphate 5-dehydrogenase n=1 Tax=Salsipaludibacter albus TaxID=2849650 RepID=UPI001EE3E43B|nr:mannitol-1-phosphate 5-dehydrogenase [Salsipaludibacter albus]MBY5161542.1 mannitol-1-phosphate 5-dehydrogenase [Salsipaludibacter albus]